MWFKKKHSVVNTVIAKGLIPLLKMYAVKVY